MWILGKIDQLSPKKTKKILLNSPLPGQKTPRTRIKTEKEILHLRKARNSGKKTINLALLAP